MLPSPIYLKIKVLLKRSTKSKTVITIGAIINFFFTLIFYTKLQKNKSKNTHNIKKTTKNNYMENKDKKINVSTSLFGYNKKQTDFEVDRLKTRIKILEGDVEHLKNCYKKDNDKKN